jgi:hypothetical protein
MSQQVESQVKPFVANTIIEAYRLVKMTAGKGDTVDYCAAGDDPIGIAAVRQGVSGKRIPVALRAHSRTFKLQVSGAIAVLGDVYVDANGYGAPTGVGPAIGIALEASTANNDIIEVMMLRPFGIDARVLEKRANASQYVDFIIEQSWPDQATADIAIYNAAAPFNFRVIDVLLENSGANGANANTIQVCAAAAGGTPISDAMSLNGIAANVLVRAAQIQTANAAIAYGGSLYLRQTKAGGVMGGIARIRCARN